MGCISDMVFDEFGNTGSVVEETSYKSRKRLFASFPDEEISKYEIPDVVCAVRSFENFMSVTKYGYKVMCMNCASSTWQTQALSVLQNKWKKKRLGRMREKKVRGDLNKVTLQLPGKLILP
jgi:hypothetical protein